MLLQIAFCLADVVARKVALLRDPFGPVIVGPDLNVQAHVFALPEIIFSILVWCKLSSEN